MSISIFTSPQSHAQFVRCSDVLTLEEMVTQVSRFLDDPVDNAGGDTVRIDLTTRTRSQQRRRHNRDDVTPAMTMHIPELNARSREDFAAAVRALDRILISGHYAIPLYHIAKDWVAMWARVKYPDDTPLYGYQLPVWWIEE
ncbi:hypothetical protein [uncultured Demequina sp.]|uniref:hypothetical protein n=1 Tax=uncultured Demequina sp. TaxID=693499 RepID=UPI0025FE9523|nr:hypothetical protein [uncultured Demequina sp.]